MPYKVQHHDNSIYISILIQSNVAFSAFMLLVGQQEGRPACKKTEWWGAGMVIYLELSADWYQLTRVVPEKRPLNGCACVLIQTNRTTHTHTHTPEWPFFRDYQGEPVPER